MFKRFFKPKQKITKEEIINLLHKSDVLFVYFWDIAEMKNDFAFIESALDLMELLSLKNIKNPEFFFDKESRIVTVTYNIPQV